MSLRSIALTALVMFAAWYWLKARELKDLALRTATRHCQDLSLKLLDDSVVLRALRLRRDQTGQLRWLRRYRFDFTSTGDDRYQGEITLLGAKVQQIHLPPHRVE